MALLRHMTALLPAQGWENNDETISKRNSCGVYALRAVALGSRDGAGSYGDGGTYYYDAVLWAVANGTSGHDLRAGRHLHPRPDRHVPLPRHCEVKQKCRIKVLTPSGGAAGLQLRPKEELKIELI